MALRVKFVVGGDGDGRIADGSTPFSLIAAATVNSTLVKVGAGKIFSIHAINLNAAVRYLKFYDMARKPDAGTGVPVRRYAIPASATGAGFVFTPFLPLRFNVGIAFVLVTGVADNDATVLTANDVVLTLEYN